MARIEAQVVGLREFQERLAALGDRAGPTVANALLAAGRHILNDAKQRVPVKSGTLKRSLTLDLVETSPTGAAVAIGTNVPYARIQEYGGTIHHPGGTPYLFTGFAARAGVTWLRKDGSYPAGTRFTRPHTITLRARPYLRPAFDAQRQAVLDTFARVLADLVEKGAP